MLIRKTFPFESKVIDEEAGIFEIIITTEEKDRDRDIVRATGGKIENYLRNPVVLLFHDYADFPVARTLSLEIMPGRGIKATFQFPPWGTYERADIARKLYVAKFLNAASIGFIPEESIPLEKDRPWGPQDFVLWELLEWSLCGVPSNQSALAVRSVGNAAGMKEYLQRRLDEIIDVVTKRGRVLSAANERKLRDAAANITEVLAQLENDEPQEESLEEMAAKDQPEGQVMLKRACSQCGTKFEQSATLALELKQSGKEALCQDCLIKSDPGIADGTAAPVTDPEPNDPSIDPTSNDMDEVVLESLSELFNSMLGAQ